MVHFPFPAVLAIRHGLTQWNADHRWQGWEDVPLSALGKQQAELAARNLSALLVPANARGITLSVVSSPLSRARDTAETFARALNVPSIEIEHDLRERHVGDWAGRTTWEINQRWPGMIDAWRAGALESPPNGESHDTFSERTSTAFFRCVEKAHNEQSIVIVVSHGGVMSALLRAVSEDEFPPVPNVGARWFVGIGDTLQVGDAVDLLGASDEARTTGTAL